EIGQGDRPRDMEGTVPLQSGIFGEYVELAQSRLGAGDPPEGDRRIECDDRGRVELCEHAIEDEDLRPVRVGEVRRFGVEGRDRRLNGEYARTRLSGGCADESDSLGDEVGVPQAAVLLRQ